MLFRYCSRHFFTLKAIVAPIAGITFFIWCIVKAHGVGPIIHQPATLRGSALGWGMVSSTMSCVSNMATLVTYVPSYSSILCSFSLLLIVLAGTPPTSPLVRASRKPLSGHSSSPSLCVSPSSASSGSSSARPRRRSMARPFGLPLTYLACSSTGTPATRRGLECGSSLPRSSSLR